MTRKQINESISRQLGSWARGYSVECSRPDTNENPIPLSYMRKIANQGETWHLTRYHDTKLVLSNNDMCELTIKD